MRPFSTITSAVVFASLKHQYMPLSILQRTFLLNLLQNPLFHPITARSHTSRGSLESWTKRTTAQIHQPGDRKLISYPPTIYTTGFLGEIEIKWNFIQHANRKIPHLHHFSTPLRIHGQCLDTTLHQRIALKFHGNAFLRTTTRRD